MIYVHHYIIQDIFTVLKILCALPYFAMYNAHFFAQIF